MKMPALHTTCSLLGFLSLCALAPAAYATEETKDPYEGMLLGDVAGMRGKLSDAGVDVAVEYKADILSVPAGGIKHGGNYLDNLDIKFALDGEKLFGIKGNKALIYFINNDGGKPNARRVGSTQGIDNIEVATNTFKLYEAWVDQSFLDEKLSVLVGLHDLNSEFDETDMTANFLKPTMQIGQTFAQSGQNGPSIFPTTSLATRVKIVPMEESYLSAAIFDGVPGDPNFPHGTHIDLRPRDGLLLVAEAGYTPKPSDQLDATFNKFGVGAWTYSKGMNDLVDVDAGGNPVKNRMMGAYILSAYQFYHDKDAGRDLGAFLRAGIADGDTAQVDWDYELGVVANGWIPARPDGEIGFGLSQAHNSDKYIGSLAGASARSEYSFELYYRDQIVKGFSVQPDFQYIINPGTAPAARNAAVIGIRLDINF